MKTLKCGQDGCTNESVFFDGMPDNLIEQDAKSGGWTKKDDGTWVGCTDPSKCPARKKEGQ